MRWLALFLLSCSGAVERDPEACGLEIVEPAGECVRFEAAPGHPWMRLGIKGQSCEPVSCMVVPNNKAAVEQFETREPAPGYTEADGPPDPYSAEVGPCAELACP